MPEASTFIKSGDIFVDDEVDTLLADKGTGMQRAVALAIVQVYAETIIKHKDDDIISKPIFFFIDEPEVCLHPLAQRKLLSALNTISKKKQIFIATHSPYLLHEFDKNNHELYVFTKGDDDLKITSSAELDLFPWSPSLGEINWFAYNLPTIEFHNELYGFLQSKAIDEDGNNYSENDFDTYLQGKGLLVYSRDWIKLSKDGNTEPLRLAKQIYIRNFIHHPENTHNTKYSEGDFIQSIKEMIDCLKSI